MAALTKRIPTVVVCGAALAASAFTCGRSEPAGSGPAAVGAANAFTLDKQVASRDLDELAQQPHPFGSPRQAQVLAWLTGRLTEANVRVLREPFTVQVPNPDALQATGPVRQTLDRDGINLYGVPQNEGKAPACLVLLGTHVDTKELYGPAYLGANDSGSSTVLLLQQLAYLAANPKLWSGWRCGVAGVFFDGEEAVLPNWSDGERIHPAHIQDNTYGSRYASGRLTPCSLDGRDVRCLPKDLGGTPVVALILMDMVGSPDVRINRDANSAPSLIALAAAGAKALGKPSVYDDRAQGIEDDHMPYKAQSVPVLDLIDFNHLQYWHKPGDEPATLSLESIETAGRLALYVAAGVAADPAAVR